MNTGIVNNFSTTFGNKQGFRAQSRQKDRRNQNGTYQEKEECRKEQKDRSSLLDADASGGSLRSSVNSLVRVRLITDRETRLSQ